MKLMPVMQEAQVAVVNQVTSDRDRAEVHRLERQLALSENEGNVIAEQLAKAEAILLEKVVNPPYLFSKPYLTLTARWF